MESRRAKKAQRERKKSEGGRTFFFFFFSFFPSSPFPSSFSSRRIFSFNHSSSFISNTFTRQGVDSWRGGGQRSGSGGCSGERERSRLFLFLFFSSPFSFSSFSFFALPRLELHDALGALLVEDPVAALAAADDVAGLELVLLACWSFFWWWGGGGGGRGERKGNGGGQRAKTFKFVFHVLFQEQASFSCRFSPLELMRTRRSWPLHAIGEEKEAEQGGVEEKSNVDASTNGRRRRRRKKKGIASDFSLSSQLPSVQLTAVAAQVGHAGGLQLRGGAEHC